MKPLSTTRGTRRHFLLLFWVLFALAEVHAQTLTRAPYLQNGSTSAITVRWRTSTATNSVVNYGTVDGSLNQTVSDPAVLTEHEVRLTGLAANTTYFYSVGSSTATLASGSTYFFITAPTGAKPTRVWVLGDPGTGSASQTGVRDGYYTFTGGRHTDLWLMLGDNAYNSGTDTEYTNNLFNIYPTMLRKSVLWPAYGNHDAGSSNSGTQTGPYYAQHTLPKLAEAGGVASGTEAYYSFNYGNIHFICLDSTGQTSRSSTGAMANWLRSDLGNNTKDWTIAFWHHPPYSKGSHNSDTETELIEMRANFLPILESYGVDLVLGGHSHAYERSFFINGHYGASGTFNGATMKVQNGNGRTDGDGAYTKSALTPLPNSGAVYTVAGSSGQASGGTLNHPAMFFSVNSIGSVVLDFDGSRLDVQFINNAGTRLDYFTISKPIAQQAPAFTTNPSNMATNAAVPSVQFNATATGTPAPTYQWQFSSNGGSSWGNLTDTGGQISGATTTTLSVLSPDLGDGGLYRNTATNTAGSVSSASATLTVNLLAQTIDFPAIANHTAGETPFNPPFSASSGLPVTLGLVSGPAMLIGSTVHLTGGGTVTLRTTQAGNATYAAAVPVDRSFDVTNFPQTISFASLAPKNVGDAPFSLTAVATSGLAVAYQSDNPVVATVAGNTVTIVGIGSATITATQPGNTNYLPAAPVSQLLVVNATGGSSPHSVPAVPVWGTVVLAGLLAVAARRFLPHRR